MAWRSPPGEQHPLDAGEVSAALDAREARLAATLGDGVGLSLTVLDRQRRRAGPCHLSDQPANQVQAIGAAIECDWWRVISGSSVGSTALGM